MEIKLNYDIPNPAVLNGTSDSIPLNPKYFYRLYNSKQVPVEWVDGDTSTYPGPEWSSVVPSAEKRVFYEFKGFSDVVIDQIRIFDYVGTLSATPMRIYAVDEFWQRKLIATFTGSSYNQWVNFSFNPVKAKYLMFTGGSVGAGNASTEIEVWGTYTDLELPPPAVVSDSWYNGLCGVNTYEWNLFEGGGTVPARTIDPDKKELFTNLKAIRHYLDWQRIESSRRSYRYQPETAGSWYLDDFYESFQEDGISILLCLQAIPNWMLDSWPVGQRDRENRPHMYGKNATDVWSYLEQAQMAFQLAARYGDNTSIDPDLVLVNTNPRWEGDVPNVKKIGLGTIRTMECANENNRGWKGRKGYQTGREHAANLSAFYDGHMGTMGDDVGVKTADPAMTVTTCGTVGIDVSYFQAIIDWSIEHRGYKPDGSPNVPFDIINFHSYRNDGGSEQHMGTRTRGMAPEPSGYFEGAMELKEMLFEYFGNNMPVVLGETGYDLNQGSIQKAIPIGSKDADVVQADWLLRLILLSGRAGINAVFLYQMYDDDTSGNSTTQYMTSGITNIDKTRRPALTYIRQSLSIMPGFIFNENISEGPDVDVWSSGNQDVYVIWSPTEDGSSGNYNLIISESHTASLFTIDIGSDNPIETPLDGEGDYTIPYSETPTFVKIIKS